ncbi:mesoderm induction early response protein 2 [Pelodytes ibericus]
MVTTGSSSCYHTALECGCTNLKGVYSYPAPGPMFPQHAHWTPASGHSGFHAIQNLVRHTPQGATASEGLSLAGILEQEEEQKPSWGNEGRSEVEEEELSFQELLSFYGYQNSDPFSDCEENSKVSDTEQSCRILDLEQAEEASSKSEQMPPSLPSGGSPSLSPRSADAPEDWEPQSPMGEEETMFGSQAQLPYLLYAPKNRKDFEEKDQLLWDPSVLPEVEVENFLNRAAEYQQRNARGFSRERGAVRDDEQALYELVRCKFHVEEALRRLYFNVKVVKGGLCAWSEDECRNFEQGFRVYGKNFHLIQANKVRTRSVGECVQYYYSWKKSERFKLFTQGRLGRRKHGNQTPVEYEDDMPESECPFRLQESTNGSGQRVGSSADIQNDSPCTDCSANKDQCTCRLSPLSGPSSEDHQEASPLNILDFPTQELPLLSGLMGPDLPLTTFSMTDMPLPDFLAGPPLHCTAPIAP